MKAAELLRAWQESGTWHRRACMELLLERFPRYQSAPFDATDLIPPTPDQDPATIRYEELLDGVEGLRASLPIETHVGSLLNTGVWAASQECDGDGWLIVIPTGLISFVNAFSGMLMLELLTPADDRSAVRFHPRSSTRATSEHPIALQLGLIHEAGWTDPGGWQDKLFYGASVMHHSFAQAALEFVLLHELMHADRRHKKPSSADGTVAQTAAFEHRLEFEADELAFVSLMMRRRGQAQLAYAGVAMMFFALETYERLGALGGRPGWISHPPAAARMDRLRRIATRMHEDDDRYANITLVDDYLGTRARDYLRDMAPRSPLNDIINRSTDAAGNIAEDGQFLSTCLLWMTFGDAERVCVTLAEATCQGEAWRDDPKRSPEDRSFGKSMILLVERMCGLLRSRPPLDRLAERIEKGVASMHA